MKKVLLICKAENDPSAYYRLGQYLNGNKNVHCAYVLSKRQFRSLYGSRVTCLNRLIIGVGAACRIAAFILWDVFFYHSEIVIVNRKIVPRYCPLLIGKMLYKYLSRRFVIWDLDDNIFVSGEITALEAKLYEKLADRVVVSNLFLKGQLNRSLWKKTDILYTTDRAFEKADIKAWNAFRKRLFRTSINLLWAGTKGNLHFLDTVIWQLDKAAGRLGTKNVVLYVVSSMQYVRKTRHLRIINIQWTRKGLFRLIAGMHIGIMPLLENEFTKGKAAFKAVQYIGAGLPVIASPVGFNKNVVQDGVNGFLTEKEWGACMARLTRCFEEWEAYSLRARKYWEQYFSSSKNMEYWMRVIGREKG